MRTDSRTQRWTGRNTGGHCGRTWRPQPDTGAPRSSGRRGATSPSHATTTETAATTSR
ncbi:MAG: hypothetical protein IPM83_00735 [Ignavibacteria bacterium]|nr:hypothetical protein [Ignavibacteria bacterium]